MRNEFYQGFNKQASGINSLSPEVIKGLVNKSVRRGNDSIAAIPLTWLSKKIFGAKKTTKGLQSVTKNILNADMHAGSMAHSLAKHIPGLRKAFLKKEIVPVTIGGKIHRQIEVPSLVAPIEKVNRIAVPAIATLAVSDYLNKRKNEIPGTFENSGS